MPTLLAATLCAAGLSACADRYEYDGSNIAWTDAAFLADGRIGLVQSAWDTYLQSCGYFVGMVCFVTENFRAHFVAFTPASGTIDTLLAFSERPRFISVASRAAFDFMDSLVILDLATDARRTIHIDYGTYGFFYATFSRSGRRMAYGKLRIDLETGLIDKPLPTTGPFKELEFSYYDDVAGKAILTRAAISQRNIWGLPPRPAASMLYDVASGTLDSSRPWPVPGQPVDNGRFLMTKSFAQDGDARSYGVTSREHLDLAAPAYDTVRVVASEYYVDLDLEGRRTVGVVPASPRESEEIFVGDFEGRETVYRARDYHPGYPPRGSR